MKKCIVLLFVICARFAGAQEKTTRPEDIRATITRHLDMTYTMPSYATKEEWLARKASLRMQILVAAGLWPTPERCPLNAQVFDRLERSGYSVEKVYFEGYPGFYVTGNLYRPLGRSGPFPGVLSPHGHWAYGRLQNAELGSMPARCITLARQGYVVFNYDMVGYNDSRQVDHRFQGEREALWGFGSLGLQLWNSIRAVDFLESLTDVDKERLACTGASGGGTQTFLLTAVDDRIKVSAPVNMISAHMQGGDVCENAPNLRIDTNNMEIGALMAPRPMIMVSATGDWTKNTLEVEYPAIRHIYELLGAEDKITAVRVNAEHNYNKESREYVYRWFGRWILGKSYGGESIEKDISPDRPADVLVFYGRPLPAGARTQKQVADEFVQRSSGQIEKLKPAELKGWESYRSAFEPALRYSLMAAGPEPREVEAFAIQPEQKPAYRVVRFYLGRKGKGDRVPATQWLPRGNARVRRSVVLVHPQGAEAFEQAGMPGNTVLALLKAGCAVLAPDTFNTGRAAFQRTGQRNYFTTYNRTDDANRVQDILTSLAYAGAQIPGVPIKVAGYDGAGLWCLLARGLAQSDASWAIDGVQFEADSDQAYLKKLNIPGIRRAGDLRTAAILNLNGGLWIHNASATFPSQWIRDVYQSMEKAGELRIERGQASDEAILAWLSR
jgi:dienelactone hydrolase